MIEIQIFKTDFLILSIIQIISRLFSFSVEIMGPF